MGLGRLAAGLLAAALAGVSVQAQQPPQAQPTPAPRGPVPAPVVPMPAGAAPPPLTGALNSGRQVVVQALDKITARLTSITLDINQPTRFGQIEILALACITRPPTEPPDQLAFLRVTEIRRDTAAKVVFSGWMFASSPAINPLEHPVYDVWVTECRN